MEGCRGEDWCALNLFEGNMGLSDCVFKCVFSNNVNNVAEGDFPQNRKYGERERSEQGNS